MDKEQSFKLLDAFVEAGGNFMYVLGVLAGFVPSRAHPGPTFTSDTANNYQNEESEEYIGEWMEKRGLRDRMVIATKFTVSLAEYYSAAHLLIQSDLQTNYKSHQLGKNESINYSGNSKRSLHVSLRDSLKKLRTDYIDILCERGTTLYCCIQLIRPASSCQTFVSAELARL